jgi:hypothetical protein
MDELVSIYILKNFEESLKNGSFSLKNKYFFVEHHYIQSLIKIFSITEDVAIKTLKDVSENLNYKLFVFNSNTLIEDLGDLEEANGDIKDMVLGLIDDVIVLKKEFAGQQKYESAARFRDIELDLKKIYHPHLLKNNDIKTINVYMDAVAFARKTAGIVKKDNPHLR